MGQDTKAKKPNMYDEDEEMLAAAQAEYDAAQAQAKTAQAQAKVVEDAVKNTPATGDAKTDALLQMMSALLIKQSEAIEKISNRSEAGPTPQIPFAQAKWQTPWNPTGEKYKRLLKRTVRLNGHRLSEILMSQETIDKLNELKPGRYNERKWTVIEEDGGTDGSALNIWMPNQRPEQRMENTVKAAGRGFDGILDIMLEEQRAVRLA